MSLKDFYYSIEDKWYGLMDSLNDKGIPVYSIIDPIDKIIPSLIVFVIIALLLISGVTLLLLNQNNNNNIPKGNVLVKLKIVDEENKPVKRALVEVIGGIDFEDVTSSKGKIEFNVPIDTEISLKISKKNYLNYTDSFFIEKTFEKTITLIKETSINYSDKTIYIVNKNGNPIKEPISVEFQCSNSNAILPENTFNTSDGEVSLKIPNNCGILMAKILSDGYETTNYSLEQGETIIRLSKIQENQTQVTGTLIVKTIEKETMTPLTGIKIEIRNQNGALIDAGTTSYTGEKYFTLPFDEYTITVTDPNQEHVTKTTQTSLYTESNYLEINLDKEYYGKIKITTIDSETKKETPATITLRKGIETQTITTNEENKQAVFLIEEPGKYYVKASKENYITSQETLIEIKTRGEQEQEIQINPCTPETCSAVKVFVIDEDNEPVKNAIVNLNDANTGFIKTELIQRITDENGLSQPVYTTLENGEYYATATKYPATGESENFTVTGEKQEIIIPMTIGTSTIQVQVTDSYGKEIPFARVEFYNQKNERIGVNETNEKGYLQKEIKADKQIYLYISKDGFAPYTTYLMQLFPNTVNNFDVVLDKEILGDKPLINFKGLFELNSDFLVDFPEPASTYNALFELIVPSNEVFDEVGVHLRTGFSNRIEKDDWFISNVNSPNAFVLKATTFSEEASGAEEVTNGASKWVNLTWNNLKPGKYLIQLEVKVKPSFVSETELPIYYRAWGKQGNKFLRDPVDEELGESENSESKNRLYANTYAKIFFETPPEPPCSEDYCFFESIYDGFEELFLTEPYSMRIDNDYNYSFTIINNTDSDAGSNSNNISSVNNTNLRIKVSNDLVKTSEELELTNYSIFNADKKEFSSNEPVFELPVIDLGNFEKGKQVSGKISLKPRLESETNLLFEIVSNGVIVFSKTVPISIFYEKEMDLNIVPETIPAFTPIMVEVKLKDKKDEPVIGADVKIVKKNNNSKTSFFSKTNSSGKAKILLPSCNPGTELIFTARKPGFNPAEKTIKVTDKVVEFEPETISSELNWFNNKDSRVEVGLTNLISRELRIKKAIISTENAYPLDVLRMQNWVNEELIDRKLVPGKKISFEFLTVLGAESASMIESIDSSGELVLELTDGASTWIQELPFTTHVSSEQQALESNCLTIQPVTWKQNILGGTAKTNNLQLINNCVNELGEPLKLKNVKARINWLSEPNGSVLIELNNEFGENNFALLDNGKSTEVFSQINEEETLTGSLEFSPSPTAFGETSRFEIEFTAELGGENPPTINGSNTVSGTISLIDLMKCIHISEDDDAEDGLIQVEPSEDETTFTINFNGEGGSTDSNSSTKSEYSDYCSDLSFDLEFCKGDARCSGGVEGGIGVMIGARQFKATNLKDTTTVTVKRGGSEIPGIYGLTVFARVHGKGAMQKITNLDVLIKPRNRDYMFLDKYAFEIYGEPTTEKRENNDSNSETNLNTETDSNNEKDFNSTNDENFTSLDMNKDLFYLTNKKFIEPVSVKANLCVWKKNIENFWDKQNKWFEKHKADNYIFNIIVDLMGGPLGGGGFLGAFTARLDELISNFLADVFGKDCHDYHESRDYLDYIIEVVKDNKDLQLFLPKNSKFEFVGLDEPTAQKFLIQFNKDSNLHNEPIEIEEGEEVNKVLGQKAELIIINNGWETEKPVYALLKMVFNEDIHGDLMHNKTAKVYCDNNSFFMFNVGPKQNEGNCWNGNPPRTTEPVTTKTRLEKFHIKLVTKEVKPELPAQGEVTQCEMGIKKGITGLDAVPKVNWNWNWGGINKNFCDAGGEITYCDATQLTIELSKKINALYGFLKANSFNLGCPSGYAKGDSEKTFEVENGKIGVSKISSIVSNHNVRLELDLTNNTSVEKTIDVNLIEFDESEKITSITLTETVSRGQTKKVSKTFTNLKNGLHTVLIVLTNPELEDDSSVSSNIPQISFEISDGSSQQGNQENCWLEKTTRFISNKPGIMHFVEANKNIKWTSEVPNASALRDLLVFNVYLIKDGYSKDFKQDFVEYYTTKSIPPADQWFSKLEQDVGLKDLFLQDKIIFETDNGSNQLTSPGVYVVNIEASFGKDWRFFKDGFVETSIKVKLHKLLDPTPNNAFYYLPLDGFLGIDTNGMERTGYGVTFVNTDLENNVQITSGVNGLRTYSDVGSNPIELITVNKIDSFKELNSNPGNRGVLFSLKENEMSFSPNYPTPVLLKVSKQKTMEQTSTYFKMKENGSVVTNTPNLSYWNGAGRCLDFTGTPINEMFLNTKDRKATQEDGHNTSDWTSSYAIDWSEVNYPGNVFLYSIFYAPQGKAYQFESNNDLVKSTGGYGKTIDLINGETIKSIQDIFPLIETEFVCVSQNGSSSSFWWNPKKVLETSGILNEINSLDAEKGNCIG